MALAKWFIAQAVTGEDINMLRRETKLIYDAIQARGDIPYSSVLEKTIIEEGKPKMIHVLEQIKERDNILSIIRSNIISGGMHLEVGYAKGINKRLIVALKEGIDNSYIPPLADELIKYSKVGELCNRIKKI